MTRQPAAAPIAPGDEGPVALLDGVPLTPEEAEYVEAARAANTLRGYRSDWHEFTTWCTGHDVEPMPAAPAVVSGYLSDLARAGAKVGTMSRRLSAMKFAHLRGLGQAQDEWNLLAGCHNLMKLFTMRTNALLAAPAGT